MLVRILALLSICLILLPESALAAPRASFSISYNKNDNSAFIRLAPASSDGSCTYVLYASGSSSNLKGDFRKAIYLGQFDAGKEALDIWIPNVPYFFRASRRTSSTRKLYFRVINSCESGFGLSDRKSISFSRVIGQGIPDDGTWLAVFRAQFRTTTYRLRRAFPNLTFSRPTDFQANGDNRVFVSEITGKIWTFLNDQFVPGAQSFLDISTLVRTEGEQGLLGFAFHPNYFQNGYVFVHYNAAGNGDSTIARYQVSAQNPNAVDPQSAQVMLTVPATVFQNHKGGQIAFGPDGFLYIAFGDGGSGGDPLGSGQNTASFLGKILRIDVDHTEGSLAYAIPSDNPFRGVSGKAGEIFAYGFRNPWRFSFDVADGQLWLADVGQEAYEEVNLVTNGGNYGWNTMEGTSCYPIGTTGCEMSGLKVPYYQYYHLGAAASITGGFVYRGAASPELAGRYIYGDFISGEIWALSADGGGAQNALLLDTDKLIVSFGRDSYHNLFVLDYAGGGIYTITSPGSPNF